MITPHYHTLSLFPEMFSVLDHGVIGRSIREQRVQLTHHQLRQYSQREDGRVDDRPYGGGPGMVLAYPPVLDAITQIQQQYGKMMVVHPSPQGYPMSEQILSTLQQQDNVLFFASRYEGIDERIKQHIDLEICVGDCVVSGGELPSMMILDALIRRIPGSLGNSASAQEDSFANTEGLLDYPHYTRPAMIDGKSVPKVLMSGDHAAILRWRRQQSLINTWQNRQYLLKDISLSKEDRMFLAGLYKNNTQEPT